MAPPTSDEPRASRLLTAEDPLPARPRRILVAGTSGSGKTTSAARIGELLGIPHVEIDGCSTARAWSRCRPSRPRCAAWSPDQGAVQHRTTSRLVAALREQQPDLAVVRLRSRSDVERWVAGPLHRAAASGGQRPIDEFGAAPRSQPPGAPAPRRADTRRNTWASSSTR